MSQPKKQGLATRRQKGGSDGVIDHIAIGVNRTSPSHVSTVGANRNLPAHLSVVGANRMPKAHMSAVGAKRLAPNDPSATIRTAPNELSAVDSNKIPPRPRGAAYVSGKPPSHLSTNRTVYASRTPQTHDTYTTLAARLSLVSSANSPRLLPSTWHPFMRMIGVQGPQALGRVVAPTLATHTSHSLLAAGEHETRWGGHVQPTNQDLVRLLQMQLEHHQQKHNQLALLAAATAPSRVVSLPPLSTHSSSHALALLDTARVASLPLTHLSSHPLDFLDTARDQLAKETERIRHQVVFQNLALRSTKERLSDGGAFNPQLIAGANPVAEPRQQQQELPPWKETSTASERSSEITDDDTESQDFAVAGDFSSTSTEIFPFKLHRMLDEAEMNGEDNIVSFFPHGRAFAVHKPREFVSKLMPKYFSTTRMPSFQRQLNVYGFQRINQGEEKGGYFHEQFLHGRPDLCKKIHRKLPGGGGRRRRTTAPDSTKGRNATTRARRSKTKKPKATVGGCSTKSHINPVVAATRSASNKVIFAPLNHQTQLQNVAIPQLPVPQGPLGNGNAGIGRPIPPGAGILRPSADTRSLISELLAIEQQRSDMLHRISVAEKLQHQADGNTIDLGKGQGIDQSEDSADLWSRIKKRW